MSDADKAFKAAEKLIEAALRDGRERLGFDQEEFRVLECLPDSIGKLKKLRELDLDNTSITDLGSLAKLTGLTDLSLDNTLITDLGPLAALTGLTGLWLGDTPITDLGPLAKLTGLADLMLDGAEVVDLRPLQRLSRLGEYNAQFGLRFRDCAATRIDRQIAEISKIADNAKRARVLFEYLKDWQPPVGAAVKAQDSAAIPQPPSAKPAPLMTSLHEGRMVRAGGSELPNSGAMERARMGWEALKQYRDSFGTTFNIHNYAPLPALLTAFDQAMGDEFDSRRMVSIGTMGSRIVLLSADTGFTENLPTGGKTDLQGLAAAISTLVNRFPDWIEYREEAQQVEASLARIVEEAEAFDSLDQALADSAQVDRDVSEEFHAEVAATKGEAADEPAAKGLEASTGEMLRTLSEAALEAAKTGRLARKLADEMAGVSDGEWAKAKFWAGGWTIDILRRNRPYFRRLALRFPERMGWINPVLDYLFGPDEPDSTA